MDDTEADRITQINTELDKLKQGFVTELSESEKFPSHTYDLITSGADSVLEQYLIRDIVPIIEAYLQWCFLDHIPLFSVPVHKVPRTHYILFGRMDQGEFTLSLNDQLNTVSGHFPLLIGFQTCFTDVRIKDDNPKTRYLIGFVTTLYFFSHGHIYPDMENVLFTWSKEHAQVIGFRDEQFGGVPSSLHTFLQYPIFCIRNNMIGRMNCA